MSERKIELNQWGLSVWKHKTNKRLFLQQSYRWKDNLLLLDETESRQIVDSFKASTFDYGAWTPMTVEEYTSVKSNYKEIYEITKLEIKLPSLNLKEIITILDEEADYYKNKRKALTDVNDILKENYDNQFSHYAQCCMDLKSTFMLSILKPQK